MTAVHVDQLTVEYTRGGNVIRPLDAFDLRVPVGSLALLLGPSGCGKTTLLSCLAGILVPTSGRVTVNGSVVTEMTAPQLTAYRQNDVGVVFQGFNLVPSLTALENVMVPLRAARIRRPEARRRAEELLAKVGLADRLQNRPAQLSGGQQQRVAIARALANDAPLILADEPTAALDHVQVEMVLRILRVIADEGRTVVVSTHDPRLLHLAENVIEMVPLHASAAVGPEERVLAPGEVLFSEGTRGDRIYFVEDGEIELTQANPGGEPRVLAIGGPGYTFGEMGALFDIQRSATARATTTTTVIGYTALQFKGRFGADHLMKMIAGHAARDASTSGR